MRLIPEWKQVLTNAWSAILAIIGAVAMAAGAAWEYFAPEDLGLESWQYLMIAALLSAGGSGARVTQQEALAQKVAEYLRASGGAIQKKGVGILAASAVALASAVGFVGGWEGKENQAYWDNIGKVWTVCHGETRGVGQGDYYSDAQCAEMLAEGLLEFERQLDRCLASPVEIPVNTKIAMTAWSWNVGVGAACRSTLMRKMNAGDLLGACHELPRWNKAGGKVIRGLSNRRGTERKLCLSELG
ncbi:lysozyme [Falsihalocynthiibacter sp. BN13B15]|uniref:lysozyme n=1 Tax=Falsihalocynthiibacter sp. BN13B15 TaxID=3240871 RepID=UPI00350F0993